MPAFAGMTAGFSRVRARNGAKARMLESDCRAFDVLVPHRQESRSHIAALDRMTRIADTLRFRSAADPSRCPSP